MGPTVAPTEKPTKVPTAPPTENPTDSPTIVSTTAAPTVFTLAPTATLGPTTFVPTTAPGTKTPTTAPTEKPNNGCCTLDFKSCINWCGPTYDSCASCNHHEGLGWLQNGPPKNQCLGRWNGCGHDKDGCCDGLTCKKGPNNNNWLSCQPKNPLGTKPPTTAPTEKPTKVPTEKPTNAPTTTAPTDSPTIVSTTSPPTNATDTSEEKRQRILRRNGQEEEQPEVDSDGNYVNPGQWASYSPHLCQKVDAQLIHNKSNHKMCESYLNLPLDESCDADEEGMERTKSKIPKSLYTVSKDSKKSLTQLALMEQNPEWNHEHYSDEEAFQFIEEYCGEDVANAYQCLVPPAYRADLFRFCILYMKGGLYLDSDLMPLVKLEELYDPCSVATVGHDWPQGRPQKQMKILAGQPGAPIFLCMINTIVKNVRLRFYPDNSLALSGPMALHECYEENSDGVSITYRDTRNAVYPYSGMMGIGLGGDERLLAFEIPEKKHGYQLDFENHEVYRPTCPLRVHDVSTNNDATASRYQEHPGNKIHSKLSLRGASLAI